MRKSGELSKIRKNPLTLIILLSLLLKIILWAGIPGVMTLSCGIALGDPRDIIASSESIWMVVNPNLFRDPYRPPGYHLLVVVVRTLFGEGFFPDSVWLVQLVLTTVMAYFVYLIAGNMFDERIALWSAAITAFYPTFIVYSFILVTDLVFIFLLTVVFHRLLLQPKLMSLRNTLLTGLLTGVWVFIRVIPLFFIPVFGLWFAWLQRDLKRALTHFTVFLLASSILVAPWSIAMSYSRNTIIVVSPRGIAEPIRKFVVVPDFPLIDGPIVDFMSLGSEKRVKTLSCQGIGSHAISKSEFFCNLYGLTHAVIEDPLWALARMHRNFKYFFQPDFITIRALNLGCRMTRNSLGIIYLVSSILYALLLLLSLIGLSKTKIHGIRPSELIILLFITYVITAHLLTSSTARYRLPLTPFMIIYAVKAFDKPRETSRQVLKLNRKNLLLWALILYFTAFLSKQISFILAHYMGYKSLL
jgi:4-amino-4-deoxy-L-arabinose transferase-like glycosyltransferase